MKTTELTHTPEIKQIRNVEHALTLLAFSLPRKMNKAPEMQKALAALTDCRVFLHKRGVRTVVESARDA